MGPGFNNFLKGGEGGAAAAAAAPTHRGALEKKFQFGYLLDTPDSSFLFCLLAFLACVLLVFLVSVLFSFHCLPFFSHLSCELNFYNILACLCHSRACFLLLPLPSVFACSFALAVEKSRTQEITKPRIPTIQKFRKRKNMQ